MKILSVTVHHDYDQSPPDSLGEYTDTPKPGAIDRQERGDMGRSEYRYFIPAQTAEETGNPDSPEQDYQRSEALNRGDWSYIGIYASADVQLTDDGPIQTIQSGGLWGIESDSGEDYLAEIQAEELGQLHSELEALGFDAETIHATEEV